MINRFHSFTSFKNHFNPADVLQGTSADFGRTFHSVIASFADLGRTLSSWAEKIPQFTRKATVPSKKQKQNGNADHTYSKYSPTIAGTVAAASAVLALILYWRSQQLPATLSETLNLNSTDKLGVVQNQEIVLNQSNAMIQLHPLANTFKQLIIAPPKIDTFKSLIESGQCLKASEIAQRCLTEPSDSCEGLDQDAFRKLTICRERDPIHDPHHLQSRWQQFAFKCLKSVSTYCPKPQEVAPWVRDFGDYRDYIKTLIAENHPQAEAIFREAVHNELNLGNYYWDGLIDACLETRNSKLIEILLSKLIRIDHRKRNQVIDEYLKDPSLLSLDYLKENVLDWMTHSDDKVKELAAEGMSLLKEQDFNSFLKIAASCDSIEGLCKDAINTALYDKTLLNNFSRMKGFISSRKEMTPSGVNGWGYDIFNSFLENGEKSQALEFAEQCLKDSDIDSGDFDRHKAFQTLLGDVSAGGISDVRDFACKAYSEFVPDFFDGLLKKDVKEAVLYADNFKDVDKQHIFVRLRNSGHIWEALKYYSKSPLSFPTANLIFGVLGCSIGMIPLYQCCRPSQHRYRLPMHPLEAEGAGFVPIVADAISDDEDDDDGPPALGVHAPEGHAAAGLLVPPVHAPPAHAAAHVPVGVEWSEEAKAQCLECFRDHYTNQPMKIPVFCSDGWTYDQETLLAWFAENGYYSPTSPEEGLDQIRYDSQIEIAHCYFLSHKTLNSAINQFVTNIRDHRDNSKILNDLHSCPVDLELLKEAEIASDGYTYSKSTLDGLEKNPKKEYEGFTLVKKVVSPMDRSKITNRWPDLTLREAVNHWREFHPEDDEKGDVKDVKDEKDGKEGKEAKHAAHALPVLLDSDSEDDSGEDVDPHIDSENEVEAGADIGEGVFFQAWNESDDPEDNLGAILPINASDND